MEILGDTKLSNLEFGGLEEYTLQVWSDELTKIYFTTNILQHRFAILIIISYLGITKTKFVVWVCVRACVWAR